MLFCACLIGLVAAVVLQGYAHHEIGGSSTVSEGRSIPPLPGVGPLVDFSGPEIRSVTPPPGEVALTFDDGPSPAWTPKLLALLRRENVPATFFVVGANAATYPALVADELANGDEVGSHTFTHADLSRVSPLRRHFELSLTQTALAGAGNVNTALLRLPYSSTPAGITAGELRVGRSVAHLGYLVVFASRDSEDWRRPGVARIAANALPPGRQGAIIMFHDAGGNRAQTVAAVPQVIAALRARGDHLVTVSALAGIPRSRVDPLVALGPHLQGLALIWSLRVAVWVVRALTLMLLVVAVLALARAVLVVVLARGHARRARVPLHHRSPQAWTHLPSVSVIVPAFNEEAGIAATVASLEASRYPAELEVIVVDDGSTDRTAESAAAAAGSHTMVLSQPNGGKPAALNAGLARSRHEIVVMVDADTVFEPDTIAALVAPLADASVGAVSGNTKVGNRGGILGRWQHIEYVMGFNLDRRMYAALGCIPTVPGAIGAFRRKALLDVGGVSNDTLAEDTDLTMAMQMAGWKVVYEESARAWTEAPATLGALWSQRYRWCYGTMQAMWKHRGALRQGHSLGRFGLPYLLLFQVLLPLAAPVVDIFAVYGLIFLPLKPVAAYWLGFNVLQMVLGVIAFRLDGEKLAPLWALPLQQLVYRQLMYLVVFQSAISALGGLRLRWQRIVHKGLAQAS